MRRDDDTVARWAYDRAIRERDELRRWIEEVRAMTISEWPDPTRWGPAQKKLLSTTDLPPGVYALPQGPFRDPVITQKAGAKPDAEDPIMIINTAPSKIEQALNARLDGTAENYADELLGVIGGASIMLKVAAERLEHLVEPAAALLMRTARSAIRSGVLALTDDEDNDTERPPITTGGGGRQ